MLRFLLKNSKKQRNSLKKMPNGQINSVHVVPTVQSIKLTLLLSCFCPKNYWMTFFAHEYSLFKAILQLFIKISRLNIIQPFMTCNVKAQTRQLSQSVWVAPAISSFATIFRDPNLFVKTSMTSKRKSAAFVILAFGTQNLLKPKKSSSSLKLLLLQRNLNQQKAKRLSLLLPKKKASPRKRP